jgi:hypothetical protein
MNEVFVGQIGYVSNIINKCKILQIFVLYVIF